MRRLTVCLLAGALLAGFALFPFQAKINTAYADAPAEYGSGFLYLRSGARDWPYSSVSYTGEQLPNGEVEVTAIKIIYSVAIPDVGYEVTYYSSNTDCVFSTLFVSRSSTWYRVTAKNFFLGGKTIRYDNTISQVIISYKLLAVLPTDPAKTGTITLPYSLFPVLVIGPFSGQEYGQGYSDGYSAGNNVGFASGRDHGYQQGYQIGYSEGLAAGSETGLSVSWFSSFLSGFASLFSIQIFGSITLGMLVGIPLLFGLILVILRLKGG